LKSTKKEFDTQVVGSFEVTKTSEVIFYYDFYGGKAWANIRKFLKSKKYTGPTGDGIKFEPELLPHVIGALENAEQQFDSLSDQEFLRIAKNKSRDFVIHASTYKGSVGIDLREWFKSKEGGGWAPQGIRFRAEYLLELIGCLKKMAETKIELKELGLQASLDFEASAAKKKVHWDVSGVPDRLKGLFAVEEEDGD
jgi:hypothetical protein